MSAAPAFQPPHTLAGLAKDYLTHADGSTDTAIEVLMQTLRDDANLLREVIEQAVHDAVTYRVEHSMRDSRRAIVRAASSPGRGAVLALAQGITNALLDMPLAGGLRLREADRSAVSAQINRYRAQANDMSHKARWLEMIAQSLTHDRKVGDVISEERALELWNEAAR